MVAPASQSEDVVSPLVVVRDGCARGGRSVFGHHVWYCSNFQDRYQDTAQVVRLDHQFFDKAANAMPIKHVSTHSPVDEGFTGPRCVPYIATGTRRACARQ